MSENKPTSTAALAGSTACNQLISGMFEHPHMLAALLDTSFNFVWVNQAYARAGKQTPNFFYGKNHFELYPHAQNREIFQQVIDSGEPFQDLARPFEYPDQPERGTTYWDLSLIPVKDIAGRVTNLVMTLVEATERVHAEELKREQIALRAEQEILQKKSHELAILLEISEIITTTLQLETVLQTIIDGATRLAAVESGAIFVVNHDDELQLGATTPPLPPGFPDQLRLAQLAEHPHIKEAMTSAKPVIVPDSANITLTEAERQICDMRGLRSLVYLPLVVEKKAVGVMILGTVGHTRVFTGSEIILYDTLSNQAALALENARLYQQVQRTVTELEERVARRTSELTRTNQALEAEIAEHRQAEEALRQAKQVAESANRAKSDFLAKMSHEIRTPLNGVLGMVHLLQESDLNPQQKKWAETILFSGETLLSVINDILDFSKIEAGKITLEQVDFDLEEMLHQLTRLMLLGPYLANKPVTLQMQLAPQVPHWLRGDSVRLRQIIFNLVSNAIKFTEKGQVLVSVRLAKPADEEQVFWLEFSVKDTGIGLSEQQLSRLFEPFAQADVSITRKYGGSGLGLVIAKRLVELLGGTLGVDSQPGQGSRFWFTAPFGASTGPQAGQLPAEKTRANSNGRLPILIAEDNDINLLILQTMLEKRGYAVTTARNGQEAVEAVRQQRFALVFMDIEMPVMDGVSAVREIRKLEKDQNLPEVPVVACTAHAFSEMLEGYLASGMSGAITKPVSPAMLSAELEKWL